MTANEPGWVEENQLAERLGWVCLKDVSRGSEPDCNWSYFTKDGSCVWRDNDPDPGAEWIRATPKPGKGYARKHEGYLTLDRALRGEKDENKV